MNNIVKHSQRLSLRYSIEMNERSNKKPANEFKLDNLGTQYAYMQREIELLHTYMTRKYERWQQQK